MFAEEAPSVSMFCDAGNHDRYAPTKHNSICARKSALEVIVAHPDFAASEPSAPPNSQITNTTPRITYKKRTLTRYVLVVENTKDMSQRESYQFLKTAVRKWTLFDLPPNSEVGLVLTNNTDSVRKNLTPMSGDSRYTIASALPFIVAETSQAPCLHCAIKAGIDMLNQRNLVNGLATSVIIVIAPGMNGSPQMLNIVKEATKSGIKIVTINYPEITRSSSLDMLARETNGRAYTVLEKRVNVDTSLLTTYFELSNILYDVTTQYYAGNIADVPLEIHRRQIKDDGRTSITGNFVLDDNLGEPARFMVYTHNIDNPLLKGLKLVSPSHQVYTDKSEIMYQTKIITLTTNITEPGTWTYTIEPYSGNPQPHFLQILATPRSRTVSILRTRFWTHRDSPGSPLVLLCEVKNGESPVLGAKVEVLVSKTHSNGSVEYKEKFDLLDTGSGDPDITKGDGVYTRYFSAAAGGFGLYTFEVTVTDNGNAYGSQDSSRSSGKFCNMSYNSSICTNCLCFAEDKPCCGSVVPTKKAHTLAPFQRVLAPVTMEITAKQILSASQAPAGRIGDLKTETVAEDLKARLSWTSPDMGGNSVARYEVRYAKSVHDIADNLEISSMSWDAAPPFPLALGSETTYTLDLSQHKELLDTVLYFAVRAFASSDGQAATVSNWVRVFVPSPPPPPTIPPTFSSNDQTSWPYQVNTVGVDRISPSIAKSLNLGLEIILPVVIGFILLVILLILYCYFCVIKRRTRHSGKSAEKHNNINDKLTSTITIIPGSPSNSVLQTPTQQGYTNQLDVPDHHTVGVPVNYDGYDDEPKKRYSLVHQQEQQLIEELKQQQQHQQILHQHQQQQQQQQSNYGGVSVISAGTLQRTTHPLSPYNSWSASQLLHEHERRHSPLENMMNDEGMMSPHQELLMNEHMQTMDGHQEHYGQAGHVPPPVPPLPAYNSNGYPVNYSIYGVHQPQVGANQQQQQQQQIYQSMQRNDAFNPSLQGSLSSVNSGEKKRRNVTMV